MRLGHVSLKVLDLEAALDHYTNTLGMLVTHRDGDERVFLKGWDEWDKYSLILNAASEAGVESIAFKVEKPGELDDFLRRIDASGIAVAEVGQGELPFCGRAIRFQLPSGHTMFLYAEKAFVGKLVGATNPEPWPDGLKGAGVHWLDHVMLMAEVDPARGINKVAETVDFFRDTLDFHLGEQVMAGPNADIQVAAWMFRTTTPHDFAIGAGPRAGLHHIAFFLDDWSDVLKTADILAKRRVKVDVTPQRHGITRGSTTYFFDPSGNRNETFAGLGYLTQPDMPVITWTEEELWRGIFYHTGDEIGNFLGVYT
ncbi:catechol 2,3-dioxygenase [Rhizorhabdus histidinilytica]|uniref:catechol 2,3-dioxygenase n=1 Tax=Rhizorhabdus histidinilytica TaxID=439228 RepID=UPI00321FFDEC